MKAVVHEGRPGLESVKYVEMADANPGPGEVKVKLKYAGLNRRDHLVLYRRSEQDPAVVLGSDGAGVVVETGPDVDRVQDGDEVVINPSLRWPDQVDAPPAGFEILGHPEHGTFAEYITISADQVEPKPASLSWEEAGVLPLSALTAYRALFTRGKVDGGQTVLIPGIGSGVATYLVQMAKAVGAKVIVTSRSEENRRRGLELGADVAIDSQGDWDQQLNGEKADIVIESVGAATWDKSMAQLRPGGTIVVFGATAGDVVEFNLRSFFYGQYNLLGTTMGNAVEFREMLAFVEKHGIKPVLDRVYPLSEAVSALKRMDEGSKFGKIALKIESQL
ncbi:MAG: zinc-binding dehydrogenase [Bacillaceae bacterium]|nr:zinc-binding dehydrogenase [Bacillaceae bacterium]